MENNWILPTWDEAERQVNRNTDDALDRFIYHNEPNNPTEELAFRTQLKELMDFMLENWSKNGG